MHLNVYPNNLITEKPCYTALQTKNNWIQQVQKVWTKGMTHLKGSNTLHCQQKNWNTKKIIPWCALHVLHLAMLNNEKKRAYSKIHCWIMHGRRHQLVENRKTPWKGLGLPWSYIFLPNQYCQPVMKEIEVGLGWYK